jgi:hypothetical protein
VISVSTVSQAQALFNSTYRLVDAGPAASNYLQAQLLAAKLNFKLAASRGEDLGGAQIYGTTTSVSLVISQADSLIAQGTTASAENVATVAGQLRAINAGDVTFTALPTSNIGDSDVDGDGVIANVDNCPLVANPDQLDTDGNGIGDACEPTPFVQCVVKRQSDYLAVFGYTNQYADRRIAPGNSNKFTPGAIDRGQPRLKRLGGENHAIEVPFSTSITWTMAGHSATANTSSTPCKGFDVAQVTFASNVALYASGNLLIDDRAKLTGWTTIANAGTGVTDIGASASVGNVLSKPGVNVRSSGTINGLVRTAGTVTTQSEPKLLGGKEEAAALSLPILEWSVTFPPVTGEDVMPEPGAPSRSIAPGSYRTVRLKNSTVLILSSGTYYMDSLDLEPGSTLQLNQAAGPVSILIKTALIYRGAISVQGGGQPSLLLGYFGTDAAFLEAPMTAAVVVPNATLTLGAGSGGTYVGSFFAKSLEIRPDVTVQFRAFGR